MKTIKNSKVETIRTQKAQPPAGELVRIQTARHFGLKLAPYWWLEGCFLSFLSLQFFI